MFNYKKSHFAAAVLAMAMAAPLPALAADGTNLLIVSENADRDTIESGHRIFNRVIQAMKDKMVTRGFGVFSENAIGGTIVDTTGKRRNDLQLIELARAYTSVPLDVMFVFQIYANIEKGLYNKIYTPQVRIAGRFLDIRTGNFLGSFESKGYRLPALRKVCNKHCLLESVGEHAMVIGRDVADAMASKMDSLIASGGKKSGSGTTVTVTTSGATPTRTGNSCGGRPTAYSLLFDNFSSEEITQVEEYMVSFKCYDHHRLVGSSSATRTEYWYETNGAHARLNRNLRLMLEFMGVKGQINTSGRGFVINKIGTF